MDSRAPAVVAVVVTTGPGPGLEATLASLVAQDYEELSLLVVANGEVADVPLRVASVAPSAFVKILDENRGFGGACNEAALSVEGAAFWLFCHDDVRLEPNAVSQMVEVAYRANAGIVTPKYVQYTDPLVLLHAGQQADRFGAVQERIEPGEIDHGQQDLERDVFVAPGGVTLIRTDLFSILRGFDPLIPALGEDLDLCWRAQIAGARIVIAPGAVVAHRETIGTGERAITAIGTRRASRQDLQRRHQLMVICTAWGPLSLLTTLPLLIILELFEILVSLVGRDFDRAGAIVGSWRFVLRNSRRIVQRRRQLRAIRVLRDPEIRRLQVAGSSRVRRFFLTFLQEGLDRARGVLPEDEAELALVTDAGVGFGSNFGDSNEFDDLDVLVRSETSRSPSRIFTSFRAQAVLVLVASLVWILGVHNLVAAHLPLIGRLAPLDSWWSTWRHFFATWSPNGLGTTTPAMPGYGVLGFFGTFVIGRMGILPRAALIFAVPVGAFGVGRLLKDRTSNRARLIGALAYLAMPLGVNMIQQGRIDVLVVVAGLPYLLRRLLSALDVPGFEVFYPPAVRFGGAGWRKTQAGQRAILLMLAAVMTALAPATFLLIAFVVIACVAASYLVNDTRIDPWAPWRTLGQIWLGVAVLVLPMTIDALVSGTSFLGLFGLSQSSWTAMSFSQLARGAVGIFGGGWGGWLLPGFAVVAVLVAKVERRVMAIRFVALATMSLLAATVVAHHWSGSLAPDVDVVLALSSLAIAVLVGIGVSSLENDLKESNFGWRQLVAPLASLVLVAAVIPFFGETVNGRFDLPQTSTAESISTLAPSKIGGYRILWLANPSVLPLSGWSVEPGLEAATSMNGLPKGSSLFTAPDAGTSGLLLKAVAETTAGETVRLGQLLAPAGVSQIVVMNASAPSLDNTQKSNVLQVPDNLIAGLDRQTDLALVLQTSTLRVYSNVDYRGIVSYSPTGSTTLQPALDNVTRTGPLYPGTIVAGLAPSSAFTLRVNGQTMQRLSSTDWTSSFTEVGGTSAALIVSAFPWGGIVAGLTLAIWLLMILGFLGTPDLTSRLRREPQEPREPREPRAPRAPRAVRVPRTPRVRVPRAPRESPAIRTPRRSSRGSSKRVPRGGGTAWRGGQ